MIWSLLKCLTKAFWLIFILFALLSCGRTRLFYLFGSHWLKLQRISRVSSKTASVGRRRRGREMVATSVW